jgi:hypothetical protein
VIVNALERLKHVADQSENAEFLFLRGGRREFHLPEIFNMIKERNAVSVYARVLSERRGG